MGPVRPPDPTQEEVETQTGDADTDFGAVNRGLWTHGPPDDRHIPPSAIPDRPPHAHMASEHHDPPPPSPPTARPRTAARRSARRQVISRTPFRGRYARAVKPGGRLIDLAWDATLRAAAPFQNERRSTHDPAIILHPDDLLKRLRLRHPGRLLLLVTDISGSMGTELMALAKRTALTLLERAYVQRDQVAMLAFRDRRAELIFPPTNQAELVQRAMADLPCGGTTPLSRALELAHKTLSTALHRDPCLQASMLLISDGKANIGIRSGYKNMLSEIEILSRELVREPRLNVLFVDTTEKGKNDYPAQWLTERLGAERFVLHRMAESGKDPALEIARALG